MLTTCRVSRSQFLTSIDLNKKILGKNLHFISLILPCRASGAPWNQDWHNKLRICDKVAVWTEKKSSIDALPVVPGVSKNAQAFTKIEFGDSVLKD